MIDTYFLSDNTDKLAAFCAGFANVIGPLQGQAAQEKTVLVDGTVIAASPAKGDPQKYYACIRADQAPTPTESIEICDNATGLSVVGVWA